MSWTPSLSQTIGFLVLSLLLYGDGTYDADDQLYDYKLGNEVPIKPPGDWFPRRGSDSDWGSN